MSRSPSPAGGAGAEEDVARRDPAPGRIAVSVVIPAFNAADTLSQTLASLAAQTHPQWEAIVVDDGSTDETSAIAAAWSARDPRVRVVRQARAGEAAARNAGLRLARFEWLLFLDADDWVEPVHLERMTGAIARDPSLDAVHCGSARVALDGTTVPEAFQPPTGDLFPVLARRAAFPVHACVVRRALVDEVGGFDPELRTSPDWDLWQRVARTGARFGAVREVLALYRMRPGSASMDAVQLARDGLIVMRRGHGPDPRVARPYPSHATGLPATGYATQSYYLITWCAGLLAGRREEPLALLEELAPEPAPDVSAHGIAQTLFDAVPVARCVAASQWPSIWPEALPLLLPFLDALEERSGAPGLAGVAVLELERRISSRVEHRPFTVGSTHAVVVQAAQPIPAVTVPPSVRRVRCRVLLEGSELGTLELPAFDGLLPADVLADAIAARWAWALLGAHLGRAVYPRLERRLEPEGAAVYRNGVRLADRLAADAEGFRGALHERVGWTVMLQEIWGRADWPNACFYDARMPEEGCGEVRPAGGEPLMLEVGEPMPDVVVEGGVADVVARVGGVPLIGLRFEQPLVRPAQIRAAINQRCGFELCRAVVREALVGAALDDPRPIRQRLADAARARDRVPSAADAPARDEDRDTGWTDGAIVLGRPPPERMGPGAWRRAALPSAVARELVGLAVAGGQPVVGADAGGSSPARVVYAPEVLTPLVRDTSKATGTETGEVPILCYRRVAPAARADSRDPHRVDPGTFESHLAALRDLGYTSLSLGAWCGAAEKRAAPEGRRVVITFDHGYADFLEHAWPLLRRFDFEATVFVVTGSAGGTPGPWGAPGARLLSWDEARTLHDEGVELGSNSVTHRHLVGAAPEDVVREAAGSRLALEERLGHPVLALAYPWGAEDEVVQHLIGACGYACAVTKRTGAARLSDPPLSLPRIEILGEDDVPAFLGKIRPGSANAGAGP